MSQKQHSTNPEIISLPPMKGGAWKVAYADFVTAMMAFFLLMWLLNATTEEQRSGIADYFDPKVPISQVSAGGMGMFNGDSVFAQERLARNGLGGAGRKASAGRDDREKHEVNTTEDVWSEGKKLTEETGNPKADGANEPTEAQIAQAKAQQEAEIIEAEIKRQIEKISSGQGLSEQLNFKMTDEGLRIDITDNGGVPMFSSGSDKPTKKMQQILAVVGAVIAQTKNEISITGHTDATPFKSRRNYGNWELSSDRAHAARRNLISFGIQAERIKRIEGRAAREPLKPEDVNDPINRRIGIVLLRDTSLEAMKREHQKNTQKAKFIEYEQEKILEKSNRSLGTSGSGTTDLFIPDVGTF